MGNAQPLYIHANQESNNAKCNVSTEFARKHLHHDTLIARRQWIAATDAVTTAQTTVHAAGRWVGDMASYR